MDSLAGVVHHAADAWERRDDRQILVVRYEDLVADLEGRMRWLADQLDCRLDPQVWPSLVEGASFATMQASASERAPDHDGVLKDPVKFFRRGTPGAGREVLADTDIAAYEQRVRSLLAAETSTTRQECLGCSTSAESRSWAPGGGAADHRRPGRRTSPTAATPSTIWEGAAAAYPSTRPGAPSAERCQLSG
jgi:hypothetical protein